MMRKKFELTISDNDLGVLLSSLMSSQKQYKEYVDTVSLSSSTLSFYGDCLDSVERLLHIFKESGEVVPDVC